MAGVEVIRVGTCSWADESFVKAWYPRGMRSGEERLRYYAENFSTVEVNSITRDHRALPPGWTHVIRSSRHRVRRGITRSQ